MHGHILKRLQEARAGKVDRSAFLYMAPKEPVDKFAQCETCVMWTGPEHQTCAIHGEKVKFVAGDTCGLYVHGKPRPDLAGTEQPLVKPEESGVVHGQVRCENCSALQGRTCLAFQELNEKMSEVFDLDTEVDPKGCCNAWHK